MSRVPGSARPGALLLLAGLLVGAGAPAPTHGYLAATEGDTLRPQPAPPAAAEPAAHASRDELRAGAVLGGFLSVYGLPPRPGRLVLSDSGLVFRSDDDLVVQRFPIVGPARLRAGRVRRTTAVALAYVGGDSARPTYFFRMDGCIFGTEAPGALLEIAAHPAWLDSLASTGWAPRRHLAQRGDAAAILGVIRRIGDGTYADTLYTLFGRPAQPLGVVGARGRRARRLGEYLASRDSLALDPAGITSEEQLRHTLAHELGHRWQARAPGQLRTLWHDIAPIRDPGRYGHGSVAEHQAEAVAFAVHYLQGTARSRPGADALALLERYEELVPGTRLMARYLALQPVYAAHPLRRLLVGGGAG